VVLRFPFRALRVGPCAARAAWGPSRFTPVRPGHASRSLFGATFRYPCFVEPFRNRAAHPHFVCRARVVRQRSWDFRTLRSLPRLRVPAFVIGGALSLRSPVSAVHPHLPLSNSHRAVDFYSCRSRVSESVKRLLPHTSERGQTHDRLRCDSTGSWVLLPQTSRAGPCVQSRPANPAMGFGFSFRAYQVLFHSTSPPSFGARSAACRSFFPNAAIRSWAYVRLRERMCSKTDCTQHGPGLI